MFDLNVLFVGDLRDHARTLQRKKALEDLGCSVSGINSRPEKQNQLTALMSRVSWKLGFPMDTEGVNGKILIQIRNNEYDLLWIEKGNRVRPGSLKEVKKSSPNIEIISCCEDDMYAWHNRSYFYTWSIPKYDAVCTTKRHNLDRSELPSLGAKKLIYFDQAFDRYLHRPIKVSREEKKKFGAPVSFVGHFEKERAESMLYLAENGVKVRIWGPAWSDWSGVHPNLQVENECVWNDEYVKVLCSSEICLGFLRKINRDKHTSRTFEIPACQSFMLAERTEDHFRLFQEGKEAEYFESKEELLKKTRYYLDHDKERERIAKAGRKRCLDSGYSHHDRVKRILSKVLQIA